MPTRRALIAGTAMVAAGALIGFFAAGGAAGPSAARPEPAAKPVRVASQPANRSQVAAAGLAKTTPKRRSGRLTVKTRISRHAIKTAPHTGDFIGLTCPRGFTALSGGASTNTIDLLISHSAPIKPTTGHYTPRTWWVAVTNAHIDSSMSELPWRPVVNCVNRLRIGK
jgi:hypothetical protein